MKLLYRILLAPLLASPSWAWANHAAMIGMVPPDDDLLPHRIVDTTYDFGQGFGIPGMITGGPVASFDEGIQKIEQNMPLWASYTGQTISSIYTDKFPWSDVTSYFPGGGCPADDFKNQVKAPNGECAGRIFRYGITVVACFEGGCGPNRSNIAGYAMAFVYVRYEYGPPKQYTIKLSQGNSTPDPGAPILASVEPGNSGGLVAKVFDESNQLVPNVNVKLETTVQANSGGHQHDGNRPQGLLSNGVSAGTVVEGNTGIDGMAFTFLAPAIAGDHKIIATCTDRTCQQEEADTVWVGVKGLQSLSSTDVYRLVGQNSAHPDNHYLTVTAASRIAILATLYRARYPRLAPLHLNDASLERGGIFDIGRDWRSPHFQHCRGAVVDIRANGADGALNITSNSDPMIQKITELAARVGVQPVWEVPKSKDSNGRFVDQWDVRHFHTKLTEQEGLQCP